MDTDTSQSKCTKWSLLNKYFKETLQSADGNNITFKCLLCIPKEKLISTSTSSNSNLRSHIKNVHPSQLSEFNKYGKKCGIILMKIENPAANKQSKLEEVRKISKKLNQTEFDKANI
ncbi:unnamed protein product [Macrosiphum euphorbiae]|uniref:BED-type domain-containing protein n=1 Tax=Macrosiphum euphorbiae TaxID=13131 RepID=A0AAV0WUN5_9HEMI|nr:unnamed protein product [Macrosiphum euphorbiae]